LARHALSALDRSMVGAMGLDPGAYPDCIDALFGANTGDWNVDCIDESRSGTVVEFNNGEPAGNAWIDTEDFHVRSLLIRRATTSAR
jgi:hypothetical protein